MSKLSLIRSERLILSDVNFNIKSGNAIFLRGDNGVGKTSLLMAIAGYLHIGAGEIAWELDNDNEEENSLIDNLHFIAHQNAIKPTLSLKDNLMFWCNLYGGEQMAGVSGTGAERPTATSIKDALKIVGLSHAIDFEAGLLSAGQKKRLSLARLLVANRALWLLDEPTSSLDREGDKLVANLIDNHLERGGIAIIATHLDLNIKNAKTLILKKANQYGEIA
ncbi:MAG: heme ABC exporter ATP-binding protein CcmA [Devosiaceae bacterium]|nr:heme ABC exporter ATP-binding protein CcmA [Devosiaceae bacterium]